MRDPSATCGTTGVPSHSSLLVPASALQSHALRRLVSLAAGGRPSPGAQPEPASAEGGARERHEFAILDAQLAPVGLCSLTAQRSGHVTTHFVAYWVAYPWRGQGHASRAVALLLRFAEDTLCVRRVLARAREENVGSLSVLARNGFAPWGATVSGQGRILLFARDLFGASGRG
jgi:GNAT superfamily N-acetyltransferase